VIAAIGVAVGAGLYSLAFFTSILSLTILAGFRLIEEKFLEKEK